MQDIIQQEANRSKVEYRDIDGFPEYRVGDDGSVWSRKIIGSRGRSIGPWFLLRPFTNASGYLYVSMSNDTKSANKSIRLLVLESFVGPCPKRHRCRHLDNVKTNNNLANLCWVPASRLKVSERMKTGEISAKEAARILGETAWQICEWFRQNILPGRKVGTHRLAFERATVEGFEKPCREVFQEGMKRCKTCKQLKANAEFKKIGSRRHLLYPYCRPCTAARSREKYKGKNKRTTWAYTLKRKYGITAEEYDKRLHAQGGFCAICHQPETRISKRSNRVLPLSVDHDHDTGKIRGLLCARCNHMLGATHDHIIILKSAIAYLEQHAAAGANQP